MPALGFQALQLVRQMAAERGTGVTHKTSLSEVSALQTGTHADQPTRGCTVHQQHEMILPNKRLRSLS